MVVLSKPALIRVVAARVPGALALLMFLVFACVGDAAAQAGLQAPEYRVKAAFVYKFGDYVEWPADAFVEPNSPLVIGVVGADALADELARISVGRTIAGRPVAVKKIRRGDSLSGLQVVFIGQANNDQVAAALEATKGRPALTVTESADGLKLGSMINFVVVSDKVRFDVALPSAEAGHIKISSRLLAVARKVVPPAP